MPSNASAFRRILHSIGSRTTPSSLPGGRSGGVSALSPRCPAHALHTGAIHPCEESTQSHRLESQRRGGRRTGRGQRVLHTSSENRAGDRTASSQGTAQKHVSSPEVNSLDRMSGRGDHDGLPSRSGRAENVEGNQTAREAAADESSSRDSFASVTAEGEREPNGRSLKVRKAQTRLSVFEELANLEAEEQGIHPPKLKAVETLPRRYFQAEDKSRQSSKIRKLHNVKIQEKRQNSAAITHWRNALRLLEAHSLKGAPSHTRRIETLRLPEGIKAIWTINPSEAVLEIMQRTGSHAQVLGDAGSFTALTLLGTPQQNANAMVFLQQSSLTRAVSDEDLNASASLKDYVLKMEVTDRAGQKLEDGKDPNFDPESLDAAWSDELDEFTDADLQQAVGGLVSNSSGVQRPIIGRQKQSIARAVFTDSPTTRRLAQQSSVLTTGEETSWSLDPSGEPWTSIGLTARLQDITTTKPRLVWEKQLAAMYKPGDPRKAPQNLVEEECVALLTEPANIPKVTQAGLLAVVQYFAMHELWPSVRKVLTTYERTAGSIGTPVYNALLAAAAKNANAYYTSYILHMMTKNGQKPDAKTWLKFYDLTLRRFPSEAGLVENLIHEFGVLEDRLAKMEYLSLYAPRGLATHLDAQGTVTEFLDRINRQYPGLRWLSRSCANKLIKVATKKGIFIDAFVIVDELLLQNRNPDVVMLNTLIKSAGAKVRDVSAVIAILQRLTSPANFVEIPVVRDALTDLETASDFQQEVADAPYSKMAGPSDTRYQKQVRLDADSYDSLFTLAWRCHSWNLCRVVWRYACCAGHVSEKMQTTMAKSLFEWNSELEKKLKENEPLAYGDLWRARAARFALGVVDSLQTPNLSEDEVRPDEVEPYAEIPFKDLDPYLRKRLRRQKRWLIPKDLSEAQSLRPALPLTVMAEWARRKDVAWSNNGIGRKPRDLTDGATRNVKQWMLDIERSGIRVPMVVGDVAGEAV